MSQALQAILEATEVEWTELNYARGRRIFRLANATPAAVAQLAEFVGTESVGEFPEFGLVRPSNTPVGKLHPSALSPPKKGIHYPIVGVVDSGTREDDPFLSPWRVAREQYVPTTNSDYDHGTFVSALIVGAKQLNQGHPEFPASQCKFVDVVAVPSGGRVSEDELVAILREVIPKYPDVKVWNMSLAGSVPCSDFCFSDFGAALDEIQQDYGVVIVLPSGNFSSSPYRSWPPPPQENDRDRICAPADSVHALCVGSTTHLDSPSALSPKGAPSPFAKRGPGPASLPKPEVTHYGGNCDANGNHAQVGVLSLDPSGNLVEGIGTSYSTPIVSSILASIQAGAETPLSPLLSRALLIHSTVLKNEGTSPEHFRFTGYGKAPDPAFALSCTASSATLVFEATIEAGTDLSRVPFAVPACLKNDSGALRGTITATLVTQTSIDPARGAEYCRNNVDVSLGVIRKNSDGEPKFTGQLKTYPKPAAANHRERQLVENGQKWSPVKVYRKSIARGVSGEAWRLLVAGTDRQGEPPGMVGVALVITIEDPDGKAPVYNDVVTSMNSLGWISTPINLRERSRVG